VRFPDAGATRGDRTVIDSLPVDKANPAFIASDFPDHRMLPMKPMPFLALAALVAGPGTSVGNTLKPQPVVASGGAQSISGTLVASSVELPQSPVPADPSPRHAENLPALAVRPDGHIVTVAGIDSRAVGADASVQTLSDRAHPPETLAQMEQDAEDLYGTPPVRDPWEKFNRKMFGFNNVLDRFVLHPVAAGYDKVVPDPVQSGVSRFFTNLGLPASSVNQALQGRPADAGHSLARFLVNSTLGIAGVFDPATHFGIPRRHGEDFGQTLATWGWRDSRYLVMPLLGPRTVRDTLALAGDEPMSAISHIDNAGVADKLCIMQMVDGRARLLPMDGIRKDALDDYALVRDIWVQRRNRQFEQNLPDHRH
jgi:phospholipid-binding lipoprotein MlaA